MIRVLLVRMRRRRVGLRLVLDARISGTTMAVTMSVLVMIEVGICLFPLFFHYTWHRPVIFIFQKKESVSIA